MLSIPDPNVTIAKQCIVFPIEFVVRGYITGTTSTALWTVYQSGQRNYCGIDLPDGLVKKPEAPVELPHTDHQVGGSRPSDQPRRDCVRKLDDSRGLGTVQPHRAGALRIRSSQGSRAWPDSRGYKYEMGRDENGEILLIDEIHTPDSSRYWIADSYQQRMREGREPDNVDKEFLRLWFTENCNPYEDEVLPPAPDDLVVELSRRYIYLYEKITGRSFEFPEADQPIETRLESNLQGIT